MTYAQQNLTREQRLIELVKKITAEELIGDDCAVLPGNRLVSSDMLVQGKHFLLPQMRLADLGWKAMAVNLSDIAAMGGVPEYALVNIAMPAGLADRDFERLFAAMRECGAEFGTRIVGGDITGSELLVISITVLGHAHRDGAILRSRARPGDLVVVTGDFGASALGLQQILRGADADPGPHMGFCAIAGRNRGWAEARQLADLAAGQGASCMDASDGLADALMQIAAASSVSLQIDAEKIPLDERTASGALELGLDPLELALYGGEDYELVACISRAIWERLSRTGSFKVIGNVVEPGRNEPGSNEPGSNEPGSNEPSSNEPGSNEPESNEPGSNEPSSNEPGSNEPESNEPGWNGEVQSEVIVTGLKSGPILIDHKKTFQHWSTLAN